jgi:hypothetical protein
MADPAYFNYPLERFCPPELRFPMDVAVHRPSECRLFVRVVPDTFQGAPAVEINQSIFQSGFILLPSHAIYSWRSWTPKRVEAIAE